MDMPVNFSALISEAAALAGGILAAVVVLGLFISLLEFDIWPLVKTLLSSVLVDDE